MSKNVKISNPMKVITGVDTRWSYANVWEPKSINGGTPKYSVSLIIPKSDTKTIAKIESAIEAAYKEGEAMTPSPMRFSGSATRRNNPSSIATTGKKP